MPSRPHPSRSPAGVLPRVLVALLLPASSLGGCRRDAAPAERAAVLDAALESGSAAAPEPAPPAPAGPDARQVDPCALVTREEAAAIVGVDLREGQPFHVGSGGPSCTYYGLPTGPVAKVDVLAGSRAESLLSTDRRLNEADPDAFRPVEELADEAYLRRGNLYFRQGDLWIVIAATRLVDPAQLDEPLVEAGRRASERLDAASGA